MYQQHVLAERVISRKVVKVNSEASNEMIERVDYMIKWKGLPYSEATWEEAAVCEPRFGDKIKEYEVRQANKKCPSGNNAYQKRPKAGFRHFS